MNKKLLVLIFLCFFVFCSGVLAKGKEETGSEQKWDIRDLDATNIKLEDVKKVVEDGRCPRWSPDGKKILYVEPDLNGIWMINPDGSNNEQITEDGYWAAWSPNGKRIAYSRYKRPKRHEISQIAIFDLEAKKEYIIWEQNPDKPGEVPSRSFFFDRIEWTKDGKKLFFVHKLMRKIDFINLDDLSFEINMPADYELAGGVNNNLTHPLFNIYEKTHCFGSSRGRKDPLIHLDFANYIPSGLNSDQEEQLCGIWAENKKRTPFAIRLLDGNRSHPELSPDLTMLLFQKRYDIYVAKISKSPTSHIKHYEVPLGLKDGLKKKNILFVSTPKINPLNNKLIGWDKEEIKGTAIVESVEKDRALVRTLLLIKDFEQNDVAVNIHNKSFGYLKEIFKEKTKEVRVIPEITGKLKEGFYLEKKEVIPPRVAIKGPENKIIYVDVVKTSAVDISSWTQSREVEADIILHAPYLNFATSQRKAKVRITISEGEAPPIRAVGEIKPPKLIKEVKPIYPEIARPARVEGVVIIEAVTDIYGRVQHVKVLRSIPLLDQAAVDAVRQWVYEPMIINGRPRGVIFTVTIAFKLPPPRGKLIKVIRDNASIKATSTIGGKTLIRVPLNTILGAEMKKGDWYKVSWQGVSGYIHAMNVEEIN